MDRRYMEVLNILNNTDYITAAVIARNLDISEKTVRTTINGLKKALSGYGAEILSKQGHGYLLKIVEEKNFKEFLVLNTSKGHCLDIPDNSKARIQYIMKILLNRNAYIKLDDLSDELFISRKTLTSDLKEVEEILKRYRITIIRKPNHGIRITGNEFDIRLCIVAIEGGYFKKGNESMDLIAVCIADSLQKYNLVISNTIFHNLVIHIYVAISRITEDCCVQSSSLTMANLEPDCIHAVADEIAIRLTSSFNICLPKSEIEYITIHLAGKVRLNESIHENVIITKEISAIVTEMLESVKNTYYFDFCNDLELIMLLSQHLIPLDVRLKHHMILTNPLLDDVKQKYSLCYMMANQAASVIENHYKTELAEDEVGYIAFALALAMERKKTLEIHKKNILLVCATGCGSAQLLLCKFKKEFALYINTIKTCDVARLYMVDYSNIDFIVTTVPIPIQVPVPIQEVGYFMETEDIVNLKASFIYGRQITFAGYMNRKLFIPHLRCKTKTQALEYLSNLIRTVKDVPDDFFKAVLEREKMAQTAFGNMVAMPHPARMMGNETFVCVAILDEPIIWVETQKVQVIFMVSLAETAKNKGQLKKFYETAATFLMNRKNIDKLIQERDYDKLIEDLNMIESNIDL